MLFFLSALKTAFNRYQEVCWKLFKCWIFHFYPQLCLRSLFIHRRDKSASKVLPEGRTDTLPDQHPAVTAPAAGMCRTKSEDGMNRKVGKGRGGEEELEAEDDCTQIPKKSFTQGNTCANNGWKCDYPRWTLRVNVPFKSYSVFSSLAQIKFQSCSQRLVWLRMTWGPHLW